MSRSALGITLIVLLTAVPLAAQDCPVDSTIGNFDVSYESAVFDGASTEFTYCITGLDVPGFHALSHWDLELDIDCVYPDDVVSCSPEPCYYQANDPTTGITGIKFDDLEVEKGETECFSFAIDGDWTALIDDVTIGLKAARDVFYGPICGPRCRNCVMRLEVLDQDTDPVLSLFINHNRPPTVIESLVVEITSENGRSIRRRLGRVELPYGAEYTFTQRLADMARLRPGTYTATVKLRFMSGVKKRRTTFVIPAQ